MLSSRSLSRPLNTLLALVALTWVGCDRTGQDDPAGSSRKPVVVATTGMIADLAREIAADHVEVIQLVRNGVDPHLYAPTRDDMQQLTKADLVLYNGLLLEGRMGDALQRLSTENRQVIAVAESIPSELLLTADDSEEADPHVWMDVALWARTSEAIRDALISIEPDLDETFTRHQQELGDRLAALDQAIRDRVQTIPEQQRVLVTAHDAFGYFGRTYDIDVRGIQGFSTESEAGLRDINELVDFLVERRIAAVFVESTVSDRNVRALIEGAQARDHKVVIGGELFSDSTGPEGTFEGTYIGMMIHNATTLVDALGGEPATDQLLQSFSPERP